MKKRYKKIGWFVFVTYLLTSIFHIVLQLMGGSSNPSVRGLLSLSMILPFISLIIVQKVLYKSNFKESLGLVVNWNKWYLSATIIPIFMLFLLNISLLLFDSFSWEKVIEIVPSFLISIVIGLSIAAISAVFEEVAWRGFLYQQLEQNSFLFSSVVTGLIWSIWHLPISIFYRSIENPVGGTALYCVELFILSLIISYLRFRGGSVLVAALFHGMINALYFSDKLLLVKTVPPLQLEMLRIVVSLMLAVLLRVYSSHYHLSVWNKRVVCKNN